MVGILHYNSSIALFIAGVSNLFSMRLAEVVRTDTLVTQRESSY